MLIAIQNFVGRAQGFGNFFFYALLGGGRSSRLSGGRSGLYAQGSSRIFVIAEETLRHRQGDEHQLIVILNLVNGKSSGNESMLMAERLIRTQHVDPPDTFRRVQMQRACEMGVHP